MSKLELLTGNEAIARGAITAGCRFFGGYPITPSSEIAEEMSRILPQVGGKFIQMEDEIAGIASAIGASLTGVKAMTATSGPGFSLKQENLGFAIMAEIPLVVVDVMRGGPSTGMPTYPSQGDVMQAKWGTHGDHEIIVMSPTSVKESFDYTIQAFNLAEKYRIPVILLVDEVIAHMSEKVELFANSHYKTRERLKPSVRSEKYKPYDRSYSMVPPLAPYGQGYRYHITGLTHDETGFPSMNAKTVQELQTRLIHKITKNQKYFSFFEERMTEDADIIVLAYGSVARSAMRAIKDARKIGIKAGLYKPITLWPFNFRKLRKYKKKTKHFIVPEMNMGQYIHGVRNAVQDKEHHVHSLFLANGELISPSAILSKIKEVMHV